MVQTIFKFSLIPYIIYCISYLVSRISYLVSNISYLVSYILNYSVIQLFNYSVKIHNAKYAPNRLFNKTVCVVLSKILTQKMSEK